MALSIEGKPTKDSFRRIVTRHISFIFVISIGSFLRLFKLGATSIWRDEIETLFFSLAQLKDIVKHALEIPYIPRPPLYYFITHYFLKIDVSSYFLRLPAALSSIFSLIVAYYLAKRLFGQKVALLSLFLLAISPFQIHYAQEGREYSFLMMLSLLSLLFLDLSLERGRKWLIPWSAASLAVLYTHHLGALIFGTQWLIVPVLFTLGFHAGKTDRKRFIAVYLFLIVVVVILWWPILLQLINGLTGPKGMQSLSLKLNYPLSEQKIMFGLMTLGNGPGTIIVIVLAALGFLPAGQSGKRGALIAIIWLLPTVLVILLGQFEHAILVRYSIFVIPLLLMATARGALLLDQLFSGIFRNILSGISGKYFRHIFSVTLVIISLVWVLPYMKDYYREERTNWKAAAAFLDRVSGKKDLIVVTGEGEEDSNFQYFILDHYAGLGKKSMVFHLDLAKDEDLRDLLKDGYPVWYAGTRWMKRYLFRLDPGIPEQVEYTALPPIIFRAHTTLSETEQKLLAPFRYKEIAVIPFWPGILSKKQISEITQDLLAKARLIPNNFVNTKTTMAFLKGEMKYLKSAE